MEAMEPGQGEQGIAVSVLEGKQVEAPYLRMLRLVRVAPGTGEPGDSGFVPARREALDFRSGEWVEILIGEDFPEGTTTIVQADTAVRMFLDLVDCVRCGKTHARLPIFDLDGSPDYNCWCMCPETQQPVMLSVQGADEPPKLVVPGAKEIITP